MADNYRLKRNDGTIREGLTSADLRSLAKLGEIHPTDMIAISGKDNWTSASNVKGLTLGDGLTCVVATPQTKAQPSSDLTRGWRSVVQECRHYVPLIESSAGQGSGLLVSANGLVVTNRHVIEGARVFMVSLYDGTKCKAVAIHRHGTHDLAIVKAALNTRQFFELPKRLATSFDAGDEAIAIGHPRGLTFTSTRGIISEPRRRLPDGEFVQTDVAINPGNSGGPLLDQGGNLIGLNTQIQRDSQGLGFAIPGDAVVAYANEVSALIRSGRLTVPRDDELNAIEEVLPPSALLEAALKSSGLEYTLVDYGTSSGWNVATPRGYTFGALASDDLFLLTKYIADLDSDQRHDSALLYQLLRWQGELSMVRFTVDDDDSLSLMLSRPAEDLDMSEVASALLCMADAVDALYGVLLDYFT
jgi:S1-C subfamily serine protease